MSILFLSQLVFAQSPEQTHYWPTDDLQKIYSLWYDGKHAEAQKKINMLKTSLENTEHRYVRTDMTYMYFLEGMISLGRKKEKQAIQAWRQAILWNPYFDFPDHLYVGASSEGNKNNNWDIFAGLQGEVQVRSTIPIPFPEERSNVALFVDGQSADVVSGVYEGKHLIQVLCPNDPIQNFWVNVKQNNGAQSFPFQDQQWYELCVSGYDLNPEGDDWLGFSTFSDPEPTEPTEPTSNAKTSNTTKNLGKESSHMSSSQNRNTNTSTTEPTDVKTPDKNSTKSSNGVTSYPVSSPKQDSVQIVRVDNSTNLLPLQIGLISTSGGLLAVGTIWTATFVRRDYRVIKEVRLDPQQTTREQADAYTEQFQQTQKQAKMFLISGLILGVSGASLSFIQTEQGFGLQYHSNF